MFFVGQPRSYSSIALIPLTKVQQDFSIGFWIIVENKLCDKQQFVISEAQIYNHQK